MNAVREFVMAHPQWALMALAHGVLTALLSLIFHPRHPGEYSPRVGAVFMLLGAIGCDVPKTADALFSALFAGSAKERSASFFRALAGLTLDAPKALSAARQLITGKVLQ